MNISPLFSGSLKRLDSSVPPMILNPSFGSHRTLMPSTPPAALATVGEILQCGFMSGSTMLPEGTTLQKKYGEVFTVYVKFKNSSAVSKRFSVLPVFVKTVSGKEYYETNWTSRQTYTMSAGAVTSAPAKFQCSVNGTIGATYRMIAYLDEEAQTRIPVTSRADGWIGVLTPVSALPSAKVGTVALIYNGNSYIDQNVGVYSGDTVKIQARIYNTGGVTTTYIVETAFAEDYAIKSNAVTVSIPAGGDVGVEMSAKISWSENKTQRAMVYVNDSSKKQLAYKEDGWVTVKPKVAKVSIGDIALVYKGRSYMNENVGMFDGETVEIQARLQNTGDITTTYLVETAFAEDYAVKSNTVSLTIAAGAMATADMFATIKWDENKTQRAVVYVNDKDKKQLAYKADGWVTVIKPIVQPHPEIQPAIAQPEQITSESSGLESLGTTPTDWETEPPVIDEVDGGTVPEISNPDVVAEYTATLSAEELAAFEAMTPEEQTAAVNADLEAKKKQFALKAGLAVLGVGLAGGLFYYLYYRKHPEAKGILTSKHQ